ncbi:Phage baseplate assembly protein V, partial [Pseudomonas amygdali pv. mori str. 301020]
TAGEVKDDMEHFEPYGFTSNPLAGAEGIAAFIGGDRSHGLLLVVADRRYRLKGLESGEVAIYTDEGDKIHLKRGKVIDIETDTLNIKAAVAVNFDTPQITQTGKIVSKGDQLAAGIGGQTQALAGLRTMAHGGKHLRAWQHQLHRATGNPGRGAGCHGVRPWPQLAAKARA